MSDIDRHEEYISKIVLELQPKSRRGYRQLFGIRENPYFNHQLFDQEKFTQQFLSQFNKKPLQRGQHVKFQNLIIAVKQIERGIYRSSLRTQVDYLFKGCPLNEIPKENKPNPPEIPLKKIHTEKNEEVYSCYCSECQRPLQNGDIFIKSDNWSRPILCLICHESLYTRKCARCYKSITFDQKNLRGDGLATVNFVECDGSYWHLNCSACSICSKQLVGEQVYHDYTSNQLFCLEHYPMKY